MRRVLVMGAAVALLSGCGDSTGIGPGAQVSVDFVARTGPAASMSLIGAEGVPLASIEVPGTNGVVSLETAHVILAHFEMERTESTVGCDDSSSMESLGDDGAEDDCDEIEQGPMFLELPLESGEVTRVAGEVQPGSYDDIEFEFENLDDEGDSAAESQRIADLLTEIRTEFPDWPEKASLRLAGTFTPEGGEPVPFVVYVDAEIEIEMEFDTPFVVTEADVARTVEVELDPRDWVRRPDGTVVDLSAYDYATTGLVINLEIEVDDAFHGAEHDD